MVYRVDTRFIERESFTEEDRERLRIIQLQNAIDDLEGGAVVFLDITEFDDGVTYLYYGGLNPDLDWQINRYIKTNFIMTSANEVGNPTKTSLALAWADRLTLSYT